MKKITVLALGGGGCRIMREFSRTPAAPSCELWAVDTDLASLADSGLPAERCLAAGEEFCCGQGCGGQKERGIVALNKLRPRLEQIFTGSDLLILIAALGGGLGTGGIGVAASVALKFKIPAVALVTLPFDMEGVCRRETAARAIREDLQGRADAVITLPNDLLFCTLPPESSLSEAVRMADMQVAGALLALVTLLGSENIFGTDTGTLMALLKRRPASCALGVGRGEGEPPDTAAALENLLCSPLLGGPSSLQKADAVFFVVLGGPEMPVAEIRAALDNGARHFAGENVQLQLGAAVAPAYAGGVTLFALTISYQTPAPGSRTAFAAPESDLLTPTTGGEQLELPMEDFSKIKGVMFQTRPVVFNGQDLDIPAYYRKGLVFKGKINK